MYHILPEYGGKRVGGFHERDVQAINDKNYFSFTVCRNPYARAVSLWWSTCRPDLPTEWDHYGFRETVKKYTSFEVFIVWLAGLGKVTNRQRPAAKVSQTIWQGGMRLDHFIHIKNLEEEFNALPFVNMPETGLTLFSNESRYSKKHYTEYLTPKAIEAVQKWAFADFKKFGYSLEMDDDRITYPAGNKTWTQNDRARLVSSIHHSDAEDRTRL